MSIASQLGKTAADYVPMNRSMLSQQPSMPAKPGVSPQLAANHIATLAAHGGLNRIGNRDISSLRGVTIPTLTSALERGIGDNVARMRAGKHLPKPLPMMRPNATDRLRGTESSIGSRNPYVQQMLAGSQALQDLNFGRTPWQQAKAAMPPDRLAAARRLSLTGQP